MGYITTSDYNRPATGCADKVAERLIKNMMDTFAMEDNNALALNEM